jgi:O-acetyl-ADP-ribose deacetylase (regulator of RNase III)
MLNRERSYVLGRIIAGEENLACSFDRPFIRSSVELVAQTIVKALEQARELNARFVTLPALATGFGPLSMEDFATALQQAVECDWTPLESLKIVLKQEEDAEKVRSVLR